MNRFLLVVFACLLGISCSEEENTSFIEPEIQIYVWEEVINELQTRGYNIELLPGYENYLQSSQDHIEFKYNPNIVALADTARYEEAEIDSLGYVHLEGDVIHHYAWCNAITGPNWRANYILRHKTADSMREQNSINLFNYWYTMPFVAVDSADEKSIDDISDEIENGFIEQGYFEE